MRNFYREWQKGHSRSEALRRATRALRDEYPHPFHWAPFVLVGKP
jgi:CHAT domain-containing protein